MRVLTPLIILGLLLSISAVVAADEWYLDKSTVAKRFDKGTREVSVAGAYVAEDGSLDSTWNLFASYGVFVAERVQVGIQWWGDEDVQSVAGFGTLHFGDATSQFVPFVSAGAGYRFLDAGSENARGADDDFVYSVGGGVKYYTSPDSSVFLKYMFAESDDVDDDYVMLGISKVLH